MPEKATRLLLDALRVYSPTNHEARLASLLARRMREEFGYSNVRQDEAGNVLGEVGRGGSRILLCGHMDTVPGRLPVVLRDGRLSGRGAVDAKSPLCAIVAAGSAMKDAKMSVTVACVTREEGDSLGVQTLIRSGLKFDFAVFGEPGGNGKVTIGYKGRVGVRLTTHTEGGHAGSPWAHQSAVDASLSLLRQLKAYEGRKRVKNDHYRSLSLCLTIIRGGTYHNVLPNLARLTLDIRVPAGTSCVQVQNDVRRIVREHSRKGDGTFEVVFEEPTEPYEADPSSRLVRAFQRAIILKTGQRPIMVRKTGTGDMNTLAASSGTQCVTYGPGDANLSHTKHEAVSIDDYAKSIVVLTESVRQLEKLQPT